MRCLASSSPHFTAMHARAGELGHMHGQSRPWRCIAERGEHDPSMPQRKASSGKKNSIPQSISSLLLCTAYMACQPVTDIYICVLQPIDRPNMRHMCMQACMCMYVTPTVEVVVDHQAPR